MLAPERFADHGKPKYMQFAALYIVVASAQKLFILDQHAAHERILFEKLKREFENQRIGAKSTKLSRPRILSLTNAEMVLLEEYRHVLAALGFTVRGETITHVPNLLKDREPQDIIMEILEKLEETGTAPSVDSISEEMLAFLACRAAVKAGDPLTDEQMAQIATDLETTPNNTTCPHGRPTRISMTIDELNMQFHR